MTIDTYALTVGGKDGQYAKNAIVQIFNSTTLQWNEVGVLKHARADHGVSVINAENIKNIKDFCISAPSSDDLPDF